MCVLRCTTTHATLLETTYQSHSYTFKARPLQGAVVGICDREISRGRRRAPGMPQVGLGGIRYIDRSMACIEESWQGSDDGDAAMVLLHQLCLSVAASRPSAASI